MDRSGKGWEVGRDRVREGVGEGRVREGEGRDRGDGSG